MKSASESVDGNSLIIRYYTKKPWLLAVARTPSFHAEGRSETSWTLLSDAAIPVTGTVSLEREAWKPNDGDSRGARDPAIQITAGC